MGAFDLDLARACVVIIQDTRAPEDSGRHKYCDILLTAFESLAAMGAQAIPFLVEAIRDKRWDFADHSGDNWLIHQLPVTLAQMDPAGIPEFEKMLGDIISRDLLDRKDLIDLVTHTFMKMGEEGENALKRMLHCGEREARISAAEALNKMS